MLRILGPSRNTANQSLPNPLGRGTARFPWTFWHYRQAEGGNGLVRLDRGADMTAMQGGAAAQVGAGDLVKKPLQRLESGPIGLLTHSHQHRRQGPQSHLTWRGRQGSRVQQDRAAF